MHLRCPTALVPRRPTGGKRPGRQAENRASRPAGSRPATSILIRGDSPGPQGTAPTRLCLGFAALDRPGRHAQAQRFEEIPGVDVSVDVCVDVHSPTWPSMSTSTCTPQTSDDRLVYTVAEAGELLGISRAFAYELVARGELPVIRLGRRRLVPKVALLALVGQTSAEDHEESSPA